MNIMFVFFPFLAIVIALFFILLYRVVYKRNMNKALHGDATQGLMDTGQLVKSLVFISLIIMNIVTISKLNDLEHQLNNVQFNLQNKVNSLTSYVYALENRLIDFTESEKLVQSTDFEIKDATTDTITYDLQFTLLEIESGATVSIVIDNQDGTVTKQLVTSDSLTFHVEVDLASSHNYDIDVLIEGTTTIQDDITNIDVKYDLDNIIVGQIFHELTKDEEEVFRVQVVNNIPELEEKNITKVVFNVYNGETLFETKTLTEPTDPSTLDILEAEYIMKENIEGYIHIIDFGENVPWNNIQVKCEVTLADGTVLNLNLWA